MFGATGQALLDVWTIAHLAFWLFVGSCLWAARWRGLKTVLGCLSLALGWEIFERFAEQRWPALWLNPESLGNAWLSDPMTCVVGVVGMWYALDHWRRS